MFEGNIKEGELEVGQVSSLIDRILPVNVIMNEIVSEYKDTQSALASFKI